ncbi:MAG TPA: glycosyltransferase [Microbacteriaceae bacterium]
MDTSDILVILPTLGDRIESLKETFESIVEQRTTVALTLAVVLPIAAAEARTIAESYGAVIVDDPKEGISAAINRGLAARTTERFYAWVGDDDLFRPGGLATLKALLDQHEDAVLAYGGCEYIDPTGKILALSNAGALAKFLLPWGPDLIPHPGTMIRLDALESIGGFDVTLKFAMDLDAFLKLRSHGRFVWTRAAVSAFRWHPDSLTVANRLDSSLESERVKRNHLPRVLRPISPVWNYPIRWASGVAASRINSRA